MRWRHAGLSTWVVQRASAVYMLFFLPFLLWTLTMRPSHTHAEWKAWVAQPAITAALCVFLIALLSHLWVGLRDVLLDYAKPASVRNVAVAALAATLLLFGGWLVAVLINARP